MFVAGGAGTGIEGKPVSVSYTPTELSHQVESNISVGGSGAFGIGLGKSVNGQMQNNSFVRNDEPVETSYIIGFGGDVYARKEFSVPILGGKAPVGDSVLSKPTYLSAPKPQQPQTSSNQHTNLYSAIKTSVTSAVKKISNQSN